MEYKLLDDLQVSLRTITPKILKQAKAYNIFDFDKNVSDCFKELSNYFFDNKKFKEVLGILFNYDFSSLSDEKIDEINLEEVSRAFYDFFLRLSTSIAESENFKKLLKNIT